MHWVVLFSISSNLRCPGTMLQHSSPGLVMMSRSVAVVPNCDLLLGLIRMKGNQSVEVREGRRNDVRR